MKSLLSLVFALAVLTAPAWIATPANAMTMEECLASHSSGYCEAALGTSSNGDTGSYDDNVKVVCSARLAASIC